MQGLQKVDGRRKLSPVDLYQDCVNLFPNRFPKCRFFRNVNQPKRRDINIVRREDMYSNILRISIVQRPLKSPIDFHRHVVLD